MDDFSLGHIDRLVNACRAHRDDQSKDRETAQEYYRGEMKDLKVTRAGRSQVTSNDVRATIKKLMPSLMRSILGSDSVVQYEPVGPGDEEGAEQATSYVNRVVIPECGARDALHDAIFDACLLKTGILKWCAYKRRDVTIQDYTDQSDDAVLGLFDDPDVEIANITSTPETDVDVLAYDPEAKRHSFRLKRVVERTDVRLEAVPRASFIISPGANNIPDAELVGEEQVVTRSQLVEWGYDKTKVDSLRTFLGEEAEEESRKGSDYGEETSGTTKALEEVMIYEVYVRLDTDDDGIAELHRVVFGDGAGAGSVDAGQVLLGMEQVDEAPYADVVIEREAHQFEGRSIYEDTRDIQRVKTAILRGILDNAYAVNNPKPAVQADMVLNPETLLKGAWGEAIQLKTGASVRDAIEWSQVPFVGANLFGVMEYFDTMAKERTGITDASGGVDPEAFQNTSATAAHLMSESGIAQADAIIRSVSYGIGRAFKGLLKLVIAHSDKPAVVRMDDDWVEYDPATWNVNMNAIINVGLGGGTKERDMSVLQIILGLQREILMTLGDDNPLVKPEQFYHTLDKITETAGFASSGKFFTKPDPDEIAAKQEEDAQKPDPEQQKLEAQMQMQMQIEQMKMQSNRDKETAQMQADLQVKQVEIQARSQDNAEKWAIEREKLAMQERLETAKIESEMIRARMSQASQGGF